MKEVSLEEYSFFKDRGEDSRVYVIFKEAIGIENTVVLSLICFFYF